MQLRNGLRLAKIQLQVALPWEESSKLLLVNFSIHNSILVSISISKASWEMLVAAGIVHWRPNLGVFNFLFFFISFLVPQYSPSKTINLEIKNYIKMCIGF